MHSRAASAGCTTFNVRDCSNEPVQESRCAVPTPQCWLMLPLPSPLLSLQVRTPETQGGGVHGNAILSKFDIVNVSTACDGCFA